MVKRSFCSLDPVLEERKKHDLGGDLVIFDCMWVLRESWAEARGVGLLLRMVAFSAV